MTTACASEQFRARVLHRCGLHLSKWSPQSKFSGPLAKGRAWFHEGFDNFYSGDYVSGLPGGQDYTTGLTSDSLSRFQVNLTPTNILTGSFLGNRANVNRSALSFLNPAETTVNDRQMLYLRSIRDQIYFRIPLECGLGRYSRVGLFF